jgi:tRNA(Ile)-lysidine synthase
VVALTVDHRLREEAAAEAAQVGAWLGARGIAHETLTWDEGASLRGAVRSPQKAARDARYRLLAQWCRARGISHLLVAHHADDQVETFLMRLARGSGVNGLAAMAPVVALYGIALMRPLLDIPKAELIAVCADAGQPWIEDPSNASTASTRVRFRKARRLLEAEGLTRARLLMTVQHMQRARAAIDHAVMALLKAACSWDDYARARLLLQPFQEAPAEIALRALERVLMAASGEDYGPRFESLERLYARFSAGPWRDSTLHGCVTTRDGDALLVYREAAHVGGNCWLASGSHAVWDGRFCLRLAANNDVMGYHVGALDTSALDREAKNCGRLHEIPGEIRRTLPALYDSQGVAAVPHADFYRNDVTYLSEALDVTAVAPLNVSRAPGAKL